MDVLLKLTDNHSIHVGKIPLETVDDVSLNLLGETEISDFFKIIDKPDIRAFPKRYQKMCETLEIQGKDALQSVPQRIFSKHLEEEIQKLQDALCATENQEYLATYLTIKRFLLGLNRAAVDPFLLRAMIDEAQHETTKRSLVSLVPEKDGRSKKSTYSMTNSATGRLTVTSGPQILTIPATARKCLKSRFPKGKILQIDIVSAEPKFALHLKGIKPPRDVYGHISKHILGDQVTRDQAKLITLCALYGQSAKKLTEQLPSTVGARGVIQKTKEYFDRDFLLSRLKNERKAGKIRNAIGRPLPVPDGNPHLLISYYLQSSVAEGSLLMFSNFIQNTSLVCLPLFVIHDALIVDCDEDSANQLLEDTQFNLMLGDWKFDAEVKVVGA